MNCWLDEFVFSMGSAARKKFRPHNLDVVSAMAVLGDMLLGELRTGALSPEQQIQYRFMADCTAFCRREEAPFRCGLQVSAAFTGSALEDPCEDLLDIIAKHVGEKKYTYIDCPPGAFQIDNGAEVQAIFISSSFEETDRQDANESTAKVTAVIGRRGVPAMQWLGWTWGRKDVLVAEGRSDDSLFPPSPTPIAMLGSDIDVFEKVRVKVERAAAAAIAYERRHRGSSLARPLPRVPASDLARRRRQPDRNRTLFEIASLKLAHEIN